MKELIAALAVLADPNASADDKAAALDKLSAYFNAQLDAEESAPAEAASEAAAGEGEMASEAPKKEGEEPAGEPEKDSALTQALEQVKALTDRVSKIEKASAVGSAPRAATRTVVQREKPAAVDPHAAVTISMIERAAKNTLSMLGK